MNLSDTGVLHPETTDAQDLVHAPSSYVLPLLLTLTIGLTITSLLFQNFVDADRARVNEFLQRGTQALVSGASQSLVINPALFELRTALKEVQTEVGNGRLVSQELLDSYLWEHPPLGLETTNFEYLPRITAEEQNDSNSLLARFGHLESASLPIMERDGNTLKLAVSRPEYFPVMIEAAYAQPVAIIGEDIQADSLNMLAMNQSRDTGMLSSYTHFPTDAEGEILITRYFFPLYDSPTPPDSTALRRDRFLGFISAVSYTPAKQIISYLPEYYQGIESIFFPEVVDFRAIDPDGIIQDGIASGEIIHSTYQLEGFPYNIATRASRRLQGSMISNNRWWVLSLGLLLTAWMASIVLWSRQQSRKIIKVVEERTHDLAQQTRKLSEVNSALAESETRYRMLANSISDVIYTHDLDGICSYISPSITKQYGFKPDDFIGKPIYQHMPDSSIRKVKSGLRRAGKLAREGSSFEIEAPIELETFCQDGAIKPVECIVSSLRAEDGSPVSFMGVMRDITLRKQAEQENELLQTTYRQAQKMEAIGTLAGGIAHDFNNLLTGVIGHADLLKMEFGDYPVALKSLDVIEMAALRAKDLTSQLLGFSRKGQFQSVPVEINQVLSEVISLIDRTVDKNIDIARSQCDANPIVMGDPAQISQIFLNLAVNARDAMPNGGKLNFDVELKELDDDFCRTHIDTKPGLFCVISVTDTGTGIPAEKIEHIFEPFFTDKTDGKGTGLGLAMVYGVTKNHKGTVSVYSEVDKGTIFKVYLPAKAGEEIHKVKQKPKSLIQGAGHILLVDDQEVVRNIGEKMLQQLGYSVSMAEDGVQGVDIYKQLWRDIDIVIIDMIMPKLGGLECLEEMRKINPDIKVVLASGFSKASIAEKINEDHIMGFLQKPFRLHELSEMVASIHQTH